MCLVTAGMMDDCMELLIIYSVIRGVIIFQLYFFSNNYNGAMSVSLFLWSRIFTSLRTSNEGSHSHGKSWNMFL